jgi:DnaJ-class molecular chaperone
VLSQGAPPAGIIADAFEARMDFYTVLGIPRNADEATIRNAYKALARQYHPDRGDGSSVEKFRQVNEAYSTLGDSASRQAYDRSQRWSNSPMAVRAEPMAMRCEPFHQDLCRARSDFDTFIDDWFDSLESLFFGPGRG